VKNFLLYYRKFLIGDNPAYKGASMKHLTVVTALILFYTLFNPLQISAADNKKTIGDYGNIVFLLQSKKSTFCLNLTEGKFPDATPLRIYGYTGYMNQRFRAIQSNEQGWYHVESQEGGRYIDTGAQGRVVVADKSGRDSQKWKFVKKDADRFILVSKTEGKAIGVNSDEITNGTGIVLTDAENPRTQIWRIIRMGPPVDPAKIELNKAFITACKKADIKAVTALLDQGVDPNTTDDSGKSGAFYVAGGYDPDPPKAHPIDHLTLLKLLVSRGANVVEPNGIYSMTPLHMAKFKASVTAYLCSLGADVNAKNYYGKTPLHEAIEYMKIDVLETLIRSGADPNEKSDDGDTAFGMLLERCDSESRLGIFDFFLKNGANPADVDAVHSNALHYSWHWEKFFTIMINRFPNLADKKNDRGQTPLMEAAQYNRFRQASLLLKFKADINARDNSGRTALMYASRKGCNDITEYLLSKNANINLTDKNGNTALHLAILENGDKNTIVKIIKYNPDITIRNNAGKTAADLAAERGFNDIYLLISAWNKNMKSLIDIYKPATANSYGGRIVKVEPTYYEKKRGIISVEHHYGTNDLEVRGRYKSEAREMIRVKRSFYSKDPENKYGIDVSVEFFRLCGNPSTGSDDRLPYGEFTSRIDFFTPEQARKQGFAVTVYRRIFKLHSMEATDWKSMEDITSVSGERKSIVCQEGQYKTISGMARDDIYALSITTGRPNEYNGITLDTKFTRQSFYYEWGGLKRQVFTYDSAGVLRKAELYYHQDLTMRCPTGRGMKHVIDTYSEKGNIVQENIEYDSNDTGHRLRETRIYNDGYLVSRSTHYDPALTGKLINAADPEKNIWPLQKTETFTMLPAGIQVNSVNNFGTYRKNETKLDTSLIYAISSYKVNLLCRDYKLLFRAIYTPYATMLDSERLPEFLVKDAKTNTDRLAAIFLWESTFVKYDFHRLYKKIGDSSDKENNAEFMVYQRFGVCENFSNLYSQLVSKIMSPLSVNYLISDSKFGGVKSISHMWNFVYVGGKYYNVEAQGLIFLETTDPMYIPNKDNIYKLKFNDYQWYPEGENP
jgi:ankyrin repeat protein